jgi:hydrogenase-4 component F
MALLFLIVVPFISALVTLRVKQNTRPIEKIAMLAAVLEASAAAVIITAVIRDGTYDLGSILSVDALGVIVLLTVTVVGLAAIFYSIGYLREEVRKEIIGFRRVRQYFALLHLFLMAMFFAVATVNPIMMWIAVEATTLATAFLISFYGKPQSMEAAWKYLILNSIGLLLGFFGTLLFLTSAKDAPSSQLLTWQSLSVYAPLMDPLIAKIAFIFVVIGYGTKAGLVPMHTWLPDAYSKAPSPISALSSGALLNVAVLAIVRFKVVTDEALAVEFSRNLLIFFGVISTVVAAFLIFQRNFAPSCFRSTISLPVASIIAEIVSDEEALSNRSSRTSPGFSFSSAFFV